MWKKWYLLGIVLLALLSPLFAQEEKSKEKLIYVPQKDWKAVLGWENKGVHISYQEYQELLKKQPGPVETPPESIWVQDVVYQGSIHEKTLSFWMEMHLVCLADGLTPFEFEFGRLGISEATLNGEPIALFSRDTVTHTPSLNSFSNRYQNDNSESSVSQRHYKVFLPQKGQYTLRMFCHQNLENKRDEQFTQLELGKFPQQIFQLTTDEKYTYTSKPNHLALDGENSLQVFLGKEHNLFLSMRPKEKKDEKKAIELVTVNASHLVKVDSVISRFTIDLEVHHRPLRTFQFVLPPGMDLLNISESRWDLEEGEAQRTLTVQLEKELQGKHQISMSCEMRLLNDGSFDLPKIEALGDHLLRQSGDIYVEKTADVKVQLENFQLARQVDLQTITSRQNQSLRYSKGYRSAQRGNLHRFGHTPFLAMEYWDPAHEIQLHKNRIEVQLESSLVSGLSIYPDGFEMATDVTFDVIEGYVKELSLQMPKGWTLTSVKTLIAQNENQSFQGTNLPSYYMKDNILFLPLEQKLVKKQRYKVLLEMKYIPESWQGAWTERELLLPMVRPLRCAYLPSFMGIIADPDYQIKTPRVREITSVDLKIIRSLQISSENLTLGLKLSSAEAGGILEVTRKIPRVSLVAAHYIRIGTEDLRYATTLTYTIKNASVNKFRFSMDDSFDSLVNVRDEFNLIKEKKERREEGKRIWEIEIQKKVMGVYSLYLTSEIPIMGKESLYSYPKLEFEGLDNFKGFIGVESSSQSEVSIRKENLETIATQDVPVFAHPEFTPQRDFSYSLKYTRPDYLLKLSIGVHEKVDVSNAILQSVNIATIYPGSDMERVECHYKLSHLGLQFFHISLPEGADFWSAVVDGKGEKPLLRNNSIAIPVQRLNNGQANDIKIVYQRKTKSLDYWGELELERPQSDEQIPIRTLSWQVFLPHEYRLTREFRGGKESPWYHYAAKLIPSRPRFLQTQSKSAPPSVYESKPQSKTLGGDYYQKDMPSADNEVMDKKRPVVKQELRRMEERSKREVVKKMKEMKREEQKKVYAEKLAKSIEKPQRQLGRRDQLEYPTEATEEESLVYEEMDELLAAPEEPEMEEEGGFDDYDFDGNSSIVPKGKSESSLEWGNKNNAETGAGSVKVPTSSDWSKKTSEAGVEAIKAKGLRSIDISLNRQASHQGSKTTSPETKRISVAYSHINTQRSLHFFFVTLSTLGGLLLLTHYRRNRFTIFMVALLVVTFLPAFFGSWLVPYSNALVLGLFLSVALSFVNRLLLVVGRPLHLAPAAALVLLALLMPAGQLQADETPQRVYVPYNPDQMDKIGELEQVFLPYADYVTLWNNAHPEEQIGVVKEQLTPDFVLFNTHYQGSIVGDQVEFEAHMLLDVFQAPASIPIGFANTSIQSVVVENEDGSSRRVSVLPTAQGYQIILPKKGTYRLQVKFLPQFQMEGKRGELNFGILPTSVAVLKFRLPEDLEVDFPNSPGYWYEKSLEGEKEVTFLPRQAAQVKMNWYESSQRHRARGLNISASSNHELFLRDNTLRLESNIKYNVASGECDRLTLRLPKDYHIIHLSCDNLEQWIFSQETDSNLITIRLVDSSRRDLNLSLKAEKVLSSQGENSTEYFPEVIPLEANRENGTASLVYQDPYQLSLVETKQVRKIRSFLKKKQFYEIFRYNEHPFTLGFSISQQRYKNFTRSALELSVEEEKVMLKFVTNLQVKEKRMFQHRIHLPLDLQITEVSGKLLHSWRVIPGEESQVLEILLQRSLNKDQETNFMVAMEKSFVPEAELLLPNLRAENVDYEAGSILLLSPTDLDLRTQEVKGLQEYDILALSTSRENLVKRYAYRYEGIEYGGKITVEAKKPELSVESVINLLVEDDWINFGYFMNFKIKYAGHDSFHFRLPKKIGQTIDILGENIREKRFVVQGDFITWTVITHNKMRDGYSLSVFPEIIKNQGIGIEIFPIQFPANVKNQISILIQDESQYEILEQQIEGLTAINPNQALFFPPSTRASNFIRAYKVNRNDWNLAFSENKQKITHTIHAAVDTVKVDTVISETGECRHRIIYNLRHSGLQFMELEKREEMKLWGVFVGQRFLRPVKRMGKDGKERILIPLAQSDRKEQRLSVRAIYSQDFPSLEESGQFVFKLPQVLNVKEIVKVVWTVHAPKDYLYKFGGNVNPTKAVSFQEYRTRFQDLQTQKISWQANEQNLKSALSNDNSLKERQDSWLKKQMVQQEQLFKNVQDVQQQRNVRQNDLNLQQIQQYGLSNLKDAQRARRDTTVYKDSRSKRIVQESETSFAGRQNRVAQQNYIGVFRTQAAQLDLPFNYDIYFPANLKRMNFSKKQGDATLEIRSYKVPQKNPVWIFLQLLSFLVLVFLSNKWKLFSLEDGYSWQKFLLTGVIVLGVIFCCNFLKFIPIFYL